MLETNNLYVKGELLTHVISIVKRLMQVLKFMVAFVEHEPNQWHNNHSKCDAKDDSDILFWKV